MPTEDYDDDEFDEVEDVDELDDDDDVEDVDEAKPEKDDAARGRRQLQRGAMSRFSDKLTGGASRPGEEDVKRSPFVMIMAGAIIGLALLAVIFTVMILSASEQRSYDEAAKNLKDGKFKEAEQRYQSFLEVYPKSELLDKARIELHTARVRMYTDKDSYTAEAVKEGLNQLEDLIRVCRDNEGFAEEQENVQRYARQLARAGAYVAKAKRLQEPLDISMAASKIMEQYAGPDGVPVSVADNIRRLQREAESEILKQSVLVDAMAVINGHIESGDTLAALESRQALIDRYEVLSDDKDVTAALKKILDKEKELTKYEDVRQDATTEDLSATGPIAASLTRRTQATVDQVSMGQLVFAVGVDSCFGLDSETGEPVWKRSVGINPPFAPVLVEASEPALLIYHTGAGELMLLSQKSGALLWRLAIAGRPAGRPLIFGGQIYLTTAAGELWKVSVTNGRAISRIAFNQPVVGPPAVSRDEKYMVLAGDQSVVYTLSISPLKCVAVSYIEHRLGSVEAPILTMGRVLLLCDNDEAEKCRLRVLDLNTDTGSLTVRHTDFINGHVRDPSLVTLRGTQLFVPSTPQRVTAFSVNDSPDADPPISKIGANQLPTASAAPVHLLAGPGGQLWMASQGLHKFRVRTNALELEPGTVARGVHLQPIQFRDQNVFLTTNEAYSSSVFFTKADPQDMSGKWRTVVGANIVAVGPSSSEESLLLVGDFGEVFRVPMQAIQKGEFVLGSISEYRIPDGLNSQVGGLALNDGRLAPFCGGDNPRLWTITASGQLEQMWKLEGVPETQPVSLDVGVIVASHGRLDLAGRPGVKGYRAPQGINENVTWKSMVALSGTQVLAIDSNNSAYRVEYRDSPSPHLFEVSSSQLEHAIELRPTAAGDLLIAVTDAGRLLALSAATLEVLGEVDLQAMASRSPHVAGDRVFVEVARKVLQVFTRSGALEKTAEIPLGGRFLVGTPIVVRDGGFVVCLSDGTVMVLDEDGRATDKNMSLGQSAKIGPVAVGGSLVVVGVDGSLYSVESVLD